ncbi:hypothetical protein [Chelativorans sp. AA-79]|uniref:hypothetical protein n=1 Tax=Chelativorans sp. AA-79 TaxID=3028735 RepID=UPI0023F9E0C6|nr:hypothetical protein [Chelativorans sp. AA-79]WEX10740.1 hypothetical protein PVE73_07310 [Chelativorans sp. AA-79]
MLADVPEDTPDLLPSAAPIYAKKVGRLTEALNRPEERTEAAEALRMLIEKIVLTPGPNRGEIDALLYGELGTILNWIERQAIGKTAKRTLPARGARECRYRWLRGLATTDTDIHCSSSSTPSMTVRTSEAPSLGCLPIDGRTLPLVLHAAVIYLLFLQQAFASATLDGIEWPICSAMTSSALRLREQATLVPPAQPRSLTT